MKNISDDPSVVRIDEDQLKIKELAVYTEGKFYPKSKAKNISL